MKYITFITFLITTIVSNAERDMELLNWVKESTENLSVLAKTESSKMAMTREWIKTADKLVNKFPPSKERTKFLLFYQTRAFRTAHQADKIDVIKIFLNQIEFLEGDTAPLLDYWTPKLRALNNVGTSLSHRVFSTIGGYDFKVSDYEGKVIILDLFATWCKPCKSMTPALQKLKAKYKDQVEILVISLDTNKNALVKYFEDKPELHVNFIGESFSNPLYEEFGVGGIPSLALINKEGTLVDLNGRQWLNEKIEDLVTNNKVQANYWKYN